MTLEAAFNELASRRVILVGGKGGVGKTTVALAAAGHLERSREVVLLRVETLDAEALYKQFLERNLAAFLEIGDRGTYLDRDELRRFFELSLPGVDELMTWLRIGEVVDENPNALVVVDTAPTGHTLRMLSSSAHFRQFAEALESMQAKHRGMVRQFTRRDVRDAMDAFIEQFEADAARRRALLTDPGRAAFVPVALPEPWVVEQTVRLIAEVRAEGIDVPFVVLNRYRGGEIDPRLGRVVTLSVSSHETQSGGKPPHSITATRLMFIAGKGGVGKTTTASSIALQLAHQHPDKRYVVISVDPAHTLRDVFAAEPPPPNLAVEAIDTKEKWRRFRDSLGEEIDRAIGAITPGGMAVAYDAEAMRKLVEIAPPGADEIFAVTRLADLVGDESIAGIIVDTAPTGHFLRLIDLPRTAGEWVREFMRILLRYRELIPAGSLGEELIRASRALHALEEAMHSDATSVIIVMRPEPLIIEETNRLVDEIAKRGMHLGRVFEMPLRDHAPTTLAEIETIAPLA